jgi:hypothetical protein
MIKQPSAIKIITIDYIAFLAFLLPVIFWVVYAAMLVLRNVALRDPVFPATIAIISVIAIGVVGWRIRLIGSIFNDGIEVPATIASISFFRDRGRIDYTYSHMGQKYLSGNAIHKVKRTEALTVGQQVIVMIDRNNPKRAFIRDLYP